MTRREERHRVNFSVRYGTARDFVVEYAENLSVGGVFIRGAYQLEIEEEVTIELTLPGFDEFNVTAKVAHVLTPEQASGHDRHPGAGFAITKAPEGFVAALRAYLLRLGHRRDHKVLVDEKLGEGLGKAGYLIAPLPPVEMLLATITESEELVIGVVVPRVKVAEYEGAALGMGAPELVKPADYPEELDDLLTQLDEELPDAEL